MSYEPPYRPTMGYADQQWPPSEFAEQRWPEEQLPQQHLPYQQPPQQQWQQEQYPPEQYPPEQYPPEQWAEERWPDGPGVTRAEYAAAPDVFDGGNQDFGTFADLRSENPESVWADEQVPRGPGVITGAVMGFLAASVAIGVATFAAAFFRPQASPIIAVGEAFIDRTPAALKEFAIQRFGEHDKMALLAGMYVTIALLALLIGVFARRRTAIGIVGVVLFGLFGAFVAYTRPASRISDVVPSLIGAVAGAAAMMWLASAAHGTTAHGTTARGGIR